MPGGTGHVLWSAGHPKDTTQSTPRKIKYDAAGQGEGYLKDGSLLLHKTELSADAGEVQVEAVVIVGHVL